MKDQKSGVTEFIARLLLTAALACGVAVLTSATNHIENGAPVKWHKLSLGLMVCFWMAGQWMYIKTRKVKILRQFFLVDVILTVAFGLLAVIGRSDLRAAGHEEFALSFLMLCIGGLIPSAGILIIRHDALTATQLLRKPLKKSIRTQYRCNECLMDWLYEHKFLIFSELVLLSLIVMQAGATLRWDAVLIADAQNSVQLSDFFNLSRTSLCGHLDMSFAMFTAMMQAIFPAESSVNGTTAATVILILCSVAAMYGVVKAYVPDRSDLEYAVLSMCWGMSPFILGMSGDYIYDLYAMWSVPVVVYFAVIDNWLLHLLAALFLIFTKEPAVVAYAGYVFGLLLTDLFIKKKEIRSIITSGRYWGMLIIGMTWLCLYSILPHWEGGGAFSLDISSALEKMKVLYVLNFNWILAVLAAVAIGTAAVKKNKFLHSVLPLITCDLFFVVFSCLFVTVNHARYIDTHIAVLNILGLLGIEVMGQGVVRGVLSCAVAVLMLVSNYYTIDPFTRAAFHQYNVGTTVMIGTSGGEYMSDSMVYNRQWEFFDKAIDQALESIVCEEKLVFYPKINGWTWFFLGRGKDETLMEQCYDLEQKKHVWDRNDDCVTYMICNADSMDVIRENLGDDAGYYIYFPFIGSELADEIRGEENVLEEKEFSYLGIVATRIKFMNKE